VILALKSSTFVFYNVVFQIWVNLPSYQIFRRDMHGCFFLAGYKKERKKKKYKYFQKMMILKFYSV
jgi:hypothetical protein